MRKKETKERTRGSPFEYPPRSEFFSAGFWDSFLLLVSYGDMEALLTYSLLLEPFNERCNDPKEDPLAQHYLTCEVSHTLQTTTAAVTSLVPYLTK